MRLVLLKKQD
jgi:hypothetical protein